MNKVRELLAKLKQKVLSLLEKVKVFLGLKEEEKTLESQYRYEVVLVTAGGGGGISPCDGKECDLAVDEQGRLELKQARVSKKKSSKKKLVKKKSPKKKK